MCTGQSGCPRQHPDRQRQQQSGHRGDTGGPYRLEHGHDELPGIRLAWVTTLHGCPTGNVIVGTARRPRQPATFEVTRDKKVVWTFKDSRRSAMPGGDAGPRHQGQGDSLAVPARGGGLGFRLARVPSVP